MIDNPKPTKRKPRSRTKTSRPGWLYFGHHMENPSAIKFGFTTDIRRRKEQIKRWTGSHSFKLLGIAWHEDAAAVEHLLKKDAEIFRFGPSREIFAMSYPIARAIFLNRGLHVRQYKEEDHQNPATADF